MSGHVTEFGFEWGAASVVRLCSDDKKGWVLIGVQTPKQSLDVYVTKTGKVRVYSGNKEWREEE